MIELSFEKKLNTLKDKIYLNIFYFPDFLSKEKSDVLYKKLHSDIPWQKYKIKIFGKTKASNDTVMASLVEIVSKYDIIAIQEIKDIDLKADIKPFFLKRYH